MELEKVEKLLDAGFTAEEIRKMVAANQEPGQDQKQETQEEKEPEKTEQSEQPAADQQPKPEPTETETRLNSIEESMKSLLKAFQTANVNKDSQPAAQNQSMRELTDAAMAALIRGSNKPREEKDTK